MRSEGPRTEAFVWVWLPGAVEPVVAGKLTAEGSRLLFHYGQSYLARHDAIALYEPELPLRSGVLPLRSGLSMPGCIRDASPDAWGRRVIVSRMLGARGGAPIRASSTNSRIFWNPGPTGRERWISSIRPRNTCPGNRIRRRSNNCGKPPSASTRERLSRISSCLHAARHFLLSRNEAIELVGRQVSAIAEHWSDTCDDADLGAADRAFLRGRQFLNPFVFEDLEGDAAHLKTLAEAWRAGAPKT